MLKNSSEVDLEQVLTGTGFAQEYIPSDHRLAKLSSAKQAICGDLIFDQNVNLRTTRYKNYSRVVKPKILLGRLPCLNRVEQR